jgi:outer membrane protein assembly factor BamD
VIPSLSAPAGAAARSRRPGALVTALVVVLGLALGGCHAFRHKADENVSPEALYQRGSKAMKDGNFDLAVKLFETLTAKFPFSDSARQSRIDLMYVYYRKHEKESAVDAADTFIRENPTHPRIDYAYYIKGLVYFEREPNFLERGLNVDLSARPPQDLRKSFEAFSRVVTQYPQSAYAADAHQRMVYLRNRLAEYEVHVAEYYMRRGAYIAAIDRARYLIENYDGAPSMRRALEITASAYDKLALPELAADSRKVLAANFPDDPNAAAPTRRQWWKFW